MAFANTKKVQSFIQGMLRAVRLIEQADVIAQDMKTKWQAAGVDITNTNITQAQVTAVNTFISELNTLKNSAVVAALKNKDIPSHGTGALG